MPIKPGSSPLTFTCSASGISGSLFVDQIDFTRAIQNFDRLEYSNQRLRAAPTTTGALPLIVQGFGNKPIQLLTTCTGDVPRPLTPDDANISNIKRRFNIIRYTIRGAANTVTDMAALYSMWADHVIRLNRFDLYLGELQMDLSINYLQDTLQLLNFSYLTTTGLSFTGNALSGTITNQLITDLSLGVVYEAPNPNNDGGSIVLQDFSLTIENRTITAQGPL